MLKNFRNEEKIMRFDFSEEEINEMYGMYQNALKEIQEQVERVEID